MSFSWTWYFPTGQSWFFCFFTAVLYTTTPIRFLVIDVQDTSCCDIYYGNNSVVVAKAQKGNMYKLLFVCLHLLLPRDKELLLCERGQKSAEVPAVDLRAARVQGHFRPKSFACCCVIYPFLRSSYHFSCLWLSIWMTSISPWVSESFGLFGASSSAY